MPVQKAEPQTQTKSVARLIVEEKQKRKKIKNGAIIILIAVVVVILTVGQLAPDSGIPSWSGMFSYLEESTKPVEEHSDKLAGEVKMSVHIIDVGQGDSILVRAGDKTVLIDAGENGYGTTVVNYLHSLKIYTLDYIIATHPHSDHIGGLDAVIGSVPVGTVIMPEIPEALLPTNKTYNDFLDALYKAKALGTKIVKAQAGYEVELGEVKMKVLSPFPDDSYEDMNNYSAALLFSCGKVTFLTCGDCTSNAEGRIISEYPDMKATLLKISHHGSSASSSKSYLSALSPQFAAISVGRDNDYGHPNKSVITRLRDAKISYGRTDISGTLIYYTDGTTMVAA